MFTFGQNYGRYTQNRQRNQQNPEQNKELITAIKNNDVFSLEKSLESVSSPEKAVFYLEVNQRKNQRDEPENFKDDNITLLHAAAFYNSLECFVFLCEEKGIALDATSSSSYFPLHYACYTGAREIVAYILSHEPSQAKQLPKDVVHHFLYFSVYGGDPVILEELFLNGADLNEDKNKADDPIGKAIDIANIECLKVLLEHENQSYNKKSQTPAMLAALNCHPDALRILVRSSDDLAYFNASNESVISLMFNYSSGSIFKDIIIDLLTKYPDTRIEPPDDAEMSGVCHWICKMCDTQVAELMIRTPGVDVNRLDQKGYTGPYYLSMQKDYKEGDTQSSTKILDILISHGFNVNLRKNATTPSLLEVFVKAMKVRYNIIEYLLKNKADPYIQFSKKPTVYLIDEVMNMRDQQLKKIFEPYKRQP